MAFPDVAIVGGIRCGTTLLWGYLITHPQIEPRGYHFNPKFEPTATVISTPERMYVKECSWFSRAYKYASYEQYKGWFPDCEEGQLVLDASADYFHTPGCAERLAAVNKDCKIIVCVRNPVNRAWSHYWWEVLRNKSEDLPFMQAIERKGTSEVKYFHYSYLEIGHYVEHVKTWLNFFGFQNILILHSEMFWQNVQFGYNAVCNFLGIEPIKIQDYGPVNSASNHGTVPAMTKEISDYLKTYYHPRNLEFYELLGADCGWN